MSITTPHTQKPYKYRNLPLSSVPFGYKSKSRLKVSGSESSSLSCANGVEVIEGSLFDSVVIGVKATCCVANPTLMKTK
ncbi:hypothetical protein FD724_37085 (plasmid) [Nostoc sp. C057]|uniref:hypothetical protein n=1 Tax=Nostoc sp. C057 TaxID=2576903 RepID=UPI0015C38B4F|nr:hypothetical protein [Nostoc sp. C057]QLE53509.1 hypothetical protein FD724_37085 [Nostoc sp. C057]